MILIGQVWTMCHPRSVTETRRIVREIGQARITSPRGGLETWAVMIGTLPVMEQGKGSFPKRCVADKNDSPSYRLFIIPLLLITELFVFDSLCLCLCASHMPHLNSLGTRVWGFFFFTA